MPRPALALAAALAALAACAAARPPGPAADAGGGALREEAVPGAEGLLRVAWTEGDEAAAREIAALAPAALRRAERWGTLRVPVTITVHPDHAALEAAARRPSVDWLRGWARFASVELESPRSWPRRWGLFGPSRREVEELVVHELVHCVMYQAVGTERTWPHKEVPLWFREGMASVTAEQAHRHGGPEPLRRFYAAALEDGAGGPRGDPLSDPEPLDRADDELVYGTAHRAFAFLLDRYGEERVRLLLAELAPDGARFAAAFRAAIGVAPEELEADFRRYVAWGGAGR